MSFSKHYSVGIHNVGSFQSSGWPWLTGSAIADGAEHTIQFPMVTKSITVIPSGSWSGDDSSGASIFVHFRPKAWMNGMDPATHHYVTLEDTDSITMNVKCTEIYITANGTNCAYEIVAELTNIPTGSMFALTGSGHSE